MDVVNEEVQKLIENTIKDILLGNTALTFLFAMPLAYISKHGLDVVIWAGTVLIAPALCCVGAWIVSRVYHHATAFFTSKWLKRGYVLYVLISAEFLFIYSLSQIIKTIIK
ncbi:hypothetical protein [Pantoea sp. USMM079]|uniref:hypothetical protein n=1 Tax=Pantoea sp. USMM079 TaxID=3081675 RepID=UPI00301E3A3A